MDYIIFCYLFFEIKKNRNRFFIYAIIYIWTKDLSSFKNPPLLKEDQESLQELNLDKDEDTLFTSLDDTQYRSTLFIHRPTRYLSEG